MNDAGYASCPSCKEPTPALPVRVAAEAFWECRGLTFTKPIRPCVCLQCGTIFVEPSELPGTRDVGL